jgi:chorismate lyase/3-hydroxybenzoate synthase
MESLALCKAAVAGVTVDYSSVADLAARPAEWWQSVLGVSGFGGVPSLEAAGVPLTASFTPQLVAGREMCEVWRVIGADQTCITRTAARGPVHYRFCNDILFGCLQIEERSVDGCADEAGALLRITELAYQSLFGLLDQTGYRHLVRIWNYIPEINRSAGGEERYRHFNSARQTAFRASGRATMGTVPAASALGSPGGSPLSIYFLAAHQPALTIENPRQTSAYHYPSKFGRHSPTFSRACLWGQERLDAGAAHLFISGTASIVGFDSIHAGDVVAQTRETLVNITALLDEANRMVGARRYEFDSLKLKVYLRRPDDLAAVAAVIGERARLATPPVFLQADVCREDLLVEIEATGAPTQP